MIQSNIAIIDYGIGNVKSILNAFNKLDAHCFLTNNKEQILNANGVILPGVGAFKTGMDNLNNHELISSISAYVKTDKPFLGICLGMQLLLDESEEFGITKGLGLVSGRVKKMPRNITIGERLPHVCWDEVYEPKINKWQNSILENVTPKSDVYFVHSYAAELDNSDEVLATCNYNNYNFCAALSKKNIHGVQFHPEKSGVVGLTVLKKFIDLTK